MRYRGYYYDSDSGFYYLQSRYYDPQICRFINADAYASTGQDFLGNNMFVYCLNNPCNHIDLLGSDAVILYDRNLPGHIGLLIQDKNGNWYHFYWGTPDNWTRYISILGFVSVPVLSWCVPYDGDITLSSINSKNQYSGTYDEMLYLNGDFSKSLEEIQEEAKWYEADYWYNLYSANCSERSLRYLARSKTKYKYVLNLASGFTFPGMAFQYIKNGLGMNEPEEK